jgi:hypothetical protein
MIKKPRVVCCRVRESEYLAFKEKCRDQGKRPQEIIESLVLGWIEK